MPIRAPAAARPAAGSRVGAEHAHLASMPLPVSRHDLDGGGLARAVRPEQGEDLATLDIEVDPAQRCHIAVALAQSSDADCSRCRFRHKASISGPDADHSRPGG
jgi:hypothetical protein